MKENKNLSARYSTKCFHICLYINPHLILMTKCIPSSSLLQTSKLRLRVMSDFLKVCVCVWGGSSGEPGFSDCAAHALQPQTLPLRRGTAHGQGRQDGLLFFPGLGDGEEREGEFSHWKMSFKPRICSPGGNLLRRTKETSLMFLLLSPPSLEPIPYFIK